MKCPSLIAVLSISAATASLAIAEPVPNDLAARTEAPCTRNTDVI